MTRLGLDPKKTREIGYLDTPYREAIAGFMLRQPRFYEALDQGGSIAMRDFRSMRDIHIGYGIIDQIESMRELFRALFNADLASSYFRSSVAGHEIRLSQIVLTALAREALDQRFEPDPIEASRLSELHRKIMTSGGRPAKLSDGFHADVEAVLEMRLEDDVRRAQRAPSSIHA